MPKYVVERAIPGVEHSKLEDLIGVARKSNKVLRGMGPQIQWVQSYISEGRTYCVFIAPSEELVREHARLGGFTVTKITRVAAVIDPSTADGEN